MCYDGGVDPQNEPIAGFNDELFNVATESAGVWICLADIVKDFNELGVTADGDLTQGICGKGSTHAEAARVQPMRTLRSPCVATSWATIYSSSAGSSEMSVEGPCPFDGVIGYADSAVDEEYSESAGTSNSTILDIAFHRGGSITYAESR